MRAKRLGKKVVFLAIVVMMVFGVIPMAYGDESEMINASKAEDLQLFAGNLPIGKKAVEEELTNDELSDDNSGYIIAELIDNAKVVDLVPEALVQKSKEPELLELQNFTDDDIIVLSKILHAESNGVASKAERAMVIWTILNRLDSGRFGSSVIEIATKPHQFAYRSGTRYSQEEEDLVKDVLQRYEAEKRGEENVGRVLPSKYVYFCADSIPSRGIWHNKFYALSGGNSGSRIYYADRDNPADNPYES